MSTFINAVKKDVGTAWSSAQSELYSAPTGSTSICIELDVCNTTVNSVTVDVALISGGTTYYIAKQALVPVGSSLQVISGQKIVLQSGDAIWVRSSLSSSLDIIASLLQGV